jgi:hypothetical protein
MSDVTITSIYDDLDRPIWGGAAIAQEIRRPRNVTYVLLERGVLPARRISGRWCTTKRRLRQFFNESTAP